MEYSPKLKKAMQKIEKILNENDIGGLIVLHEPSFSEYLIKLDTQYSVINKGPNGSFKFELKSSESVKIGNTINLLRLIAETAGKVSLETYKFEETLTDIISGKFKVEHTKKKHKPGIENEN